MNAEKKKAEPVAHANDDMIRVAEAAEILGVNRTTLGDWAKTGKVRAFPVNPGSGKVIYKFCYGEIVALRRKWDKEKREAARQQKDKAKQAKAQSPQINDAGWRMFKAFKEAVTALMTAELEYQDDDRQTDAVAGLVELNLMTEREFDAIRKSAGMTLAQLAFDYLEYHRGSEDRKRGPEWPMHDVLPTVVTESADAGQQPG